MAIEQPILIGWQSDPPLISGPHGPKLIAVIQKYTTSGMTVLAPDAYGNLILYKPWSRR
jgi:hypothetical protein